MGEWWRLFSRFPFCVPSSLSAFLSASGLYRFSWPLDVCVRVCMCVCARSPGCPGVRALLCIGPDEFSAPGTAYLGNTWYRLLRFPGQIEEVKGLWSSRSVFCV